MTNPNIWEADVLPQKNKKTEPTDLVIAAKCTPTGAYVGGLTLREYFAAMAMQGLIASLSSELVQRQLREVQDALGMPEGKNEFVIVKCACDYANALIAELNKEAK